MKRIVFLLLVTCLLLSNLNATIWYVDSKCKGDGTSWANAASDIMTLIDCDSASFYGLACTSVIPRDTTLPNYVHPGDSIFVASGTYSPIFLWNGQNSCQNRIHIFGGFEGWESSVCERKKWRKNESVIVGKYVCYVVWIEGTSNVTLDGFTITEGQGEGAGLRLVNCVTKLSNLIIKNNEAKNTRGGGIFFESCGRIDDCGAGPINTSLINVLITENSASIASAFCALNSDITFVNATITNNNTKDSGSYIDVKYNCNIDFYNSILWGNDKPVISYVQSPFVNFSYCDVEDLKFVGNDVINNIDKNPMFINPPFDYHVKPNSIAIGTGDVSAYLYLLKQFCSNCFLSFDLDATNRFYNNKTIDMGCYQHNKYYSPIMESKNIQEQSQTNDAIIEFYSPCGIIISTCNKADINQTKSSLNNGFYILIEKSSNGEVLKVDKLIINQ